MDQNGFNSNNFFDGPVFIDGNTDIDGNLEVTGTVVEQPTNINTRIKYFILLLPYCVLQQILLV
jgi:cytoskeletal protein CcmA (bactofilin family)